MEIRIGIQNVAREVTFESDATREDVERAVEAALDGGGPLRLDDSKGGRLIVPAASLGYVHVGPSERGRVGFGIG